MIERYANLRAQRLLQPLPPDQTNVERGAIAACYELAALPEQLAQHLGAHDAQARQHGNESDPRVDFHWQWGSSIFSDDFTTGAAERRHD